MGVGKTAVSRELLSRLPLFDAMDCVRIDTTSLSPREIAAQIITTGDSL